MAKYIHITLDDQDTGLVPTLCKRIVCGAPHHLWVNRTREYSLAGLEKIYASEEAISRWWPDHYVAGKFRNALGKTACPRCAELHAIQDLARIKLD